MTESGELRLTWGPTTVVLAADGAEIRVGASCLRVTADGAELSVAGGGRVSVRADEVELALGSASVRLSGGTVSLNDGGLEVT